jgi:hypothetical protein
MGFLITVMAMPTGWIWAYWANVFRYILQGIVTNELAGKEYFVNISGLLPDLIDSNTTGVLGFVGSSTEASLKSREQIAGFMSLVESAGPGTNEEGGNLLPLLNCTLSSGCFADQDQDLASSFIDCYIFAGIFRSPPCEDEFNAVIQTINFTALLQCFDIPGIDLPQITLPGLPDLGVVDDATEAPSSSTVGNDSGDELGSATNTPTNAVMDQSIFPDGFLGGGNRELLDFPGLLVDIFSNRTDTNGTMASENFDLVLCLVRALLPPDILAALEDLMEIFASLVGLVPIIVDIVDQGGLYIPGEIILSFFGWAEFSIADGFEAPWKWWYCLGAVFIFLVFIESLKLLSVSFIVWTNR